MNLAAPSAAPFFQPLINRGIIAGTVLLVADRQGVRGVEALGCADLATGRPMAEDTLFWIASTSKPLTGTLLMMLIEEGKLHPDDPIEKYLPEFRGQMLVDEQTDDHLLLRKPAHPITLRDCLTHTSGLPFRSPVEQPSLDGLPLAAAVRSHAMMPLLFEPGTRYLYSNAGTNTAARLIEVVTGEPFADFLQKRLLDPLGMTDTTFWPDDEQVARLAKTYRLTGTDDAPGSLEELPIEYMLYPLTDHARRFGFPAGGLFSTARDCATFARMIANLGALDGRRYLSEASVREMTSKHTGPDVADEYGYLWKCGEGFWGHAGAYRNTFLIEPKTGLSFIGMVQSVGAGGAPLDEALKAWRQAARERLEQG